MNFDWVLAPVTQAVILGAGLLGSLAIWIGAKVETQAARRALEALRVSAEATDGKIKALAAQILEMLVVGAGDRALAPLQGINLTTRTKVLRMHGRGETTSCIAAALGVQYEEVDLLLRLDRMLDSKPASLAN